MLLLSFAFNSVAQTQFWADSFEDSGSPSSGSRTLSVAEFKCTSGFFKRTDGSDKTWIAGPNSSSATGDFIGANGSKYFGAMDIDRGPGCGGNNTISAAQTITWSGINIAGKSGLTFKGLFGANEGAVFQSVAFNTSANGFVMDYIVVEYKIDGAMNWTKALGIYPIDPSLNGSALAVDNIGGDMVGDGSPLTNALAELSATIVGTGSLLDLRISLFINNGNPGAVAFDNFRLFGTAACTAPTIAGNPPNRTICLGSNTTFSASATGATAYQWQVNTGSGFTDITNGAPYSGATTTTLAVTGATAAMSGYTYRMVAINGVATCFTNTNSSTLTVSNITASTSQINVSCFGGNNGAAGVSPSGGIAPYSYSWSPMGATSSSVSGLTAGTYTVTITDNIGCQTTRSFTIEQPTIVSGTTSVTNVSCNGGSNGTINLTPTGGTGPYTYAWTGGAATEDRTGLSAGSYSVTITDSKGCTGTLTGIIVTQPTVLASNYNGVTTINKDVVYNYSFAATGGTPSYLYSHTGNLPNGLTLSGAGLLSGTPTTAGTFNFTVVVTDANSCEANVSVSITVQGVLPVELDGFTAKAVASGVEISWKTLSERNSSHFNLLHAGEDGKFKSIAKIDAMGNSSVGKNYTLLHREALNGANYYQLLQIDKNGDVKDYGVKTADFAIAEKHDVALYPNPTTHTVTVKFAAKTYTQVRVVDMLGKTVITKQLGASQTEQVINVGNLARGTYTMILTGGVSRSVHKLIKL